MKKAGVLAAILLLPLSLCFGQKIPATGIRQSFTNQSPSTIIKGSSGTSPDLTPFKPDGWSDKIVVTNRIDTYTDDVPLSTTDEIFIDWAVINNGTATTALFITRLFLDGILITWSETPAPLPASYYTYIQDFSIGRLPAGTHTIQIVADATNTIAESNEANNEYSRSFVITGSSLADLTPFKPDGWSGKIVVSKKTGTNTDDNAIIETDDVFIDFAVLNSGVAVLIRFYACLYLDGAPMDSSYTEPALLTNYYSYLEDVSIGKLPPGTYTIRVLVDATGVIHESNEDNNDFSKTFTVSPNPALKPDLALTDISLKPEIVLKGSDVEVTANVSNLGVSSASGMQLYFYLSKDSLLDSGDIRVCETQPQLLSGLTNIILQSGFTVPDPQDTGTYYLIGFADPLDAVKELNEGNNKFARPFRVTDNSGIDEVSEMLRIKVFPNPAHDVIMVDLTGSMLNIRRIEIMNLLGQVVYSRATAEVESTFRLSVSDLAAGIYELVLTTADGRVRKMVVVE
jgi:subtilase family serine protease